MSSITLLGDTSGSVVIDAPAIAGSNTITLPTTGGTIRTTRTPGTVLQVVQGITPSNYSTSSSSLTATGYGLSITPTSSSSRILIFLAGQMDSGAANNQAIIQLRRGTTDLGAGTASSVFSAANRMISGISVVYLDSPATTSPTTYNLFFAAGSSLTITWASGSTLTLMEIAA